MSEWNTETLTDASSHSDWSTDVVEMASSKSQVSNIVARETLTTEARELTLIFSSIISKSG
jgi:hypothetical protein